VRPVSGKDGVSWLSEAAVVALVSIRLKRMSKAEARTDEQGPLAAPEDVIHVMGDMNGAKLLDIMALQATIRDVEEAALWLAGDADVYGAGSPLKGVAGEIVAIVTADEQEEPPRQG